MLVISRKPTESIQVGETKVVVLEAKSGRVNLGFEGPSTIPIWRSEIPATIPTRVPSEHAMFAIKMRDMIRNLLGAMREPDRFGDKWETLVGVPKQRLADAEKLVDAYDSFLFDEE